MEPYRPEHYQAPFYKGSRAGALRFAHRLADAQQRAWYVSRIRGDEWGIFQSYVGKRDDVVVEPRSAKTRQKKR